MSCFRAACLAALLAPSAALSQNLADSLKALRRMIDAHPDDIAAHEAFVSLTEDQVIVRDAEHYARTVAEAVARLSADYQRWLHRFPRSAGVRYGFGMVFSDIEDPRAEPYLRDAVRLDPHLAKAYYALSLDADRRGDPGEGHALVGKAAAADSLDPDYAYHYAMGFTEPRLHEMVQAIVAKFPTSARAPQAITWEAYRAATDSERLALLEPLHARFLADPRDQRFRWAWSGMDELFNVYVRRGSFQQAVTLAEDMLRRASEPDEQQEGAERVVYARNLALAASLRAEQKYAAAAAVLAVTHPPHDDARTAETLALLRASVTDSQAAFDSLVAYAAGKPTDSVDAALRRAATKLGKTPTEVDSAVWALRDRAATSAAPFTLARSVVPPADSVSLGDFRGRVVLLTFWYPGCGPCRGEFPRLQAVVDAFAPRGLAYVAINVDPNQKPYVGPFVRGYHYTFTSLEGTDAMAAGLYHVRGEPTNFLIDRGGRIVFKGFYAHDAEGQRTLELMVTSMLAH